MPKGQQRGNREVKKPKKAKAAAPPPTSWPKGLSATPAAGRTAPSPKKK